MRRPAYTRYTLRLTADAAAASAGRQPAVPTASQAAGAIAQADDWSGAAAAYAFRPDPQALNYVCPEAVALIAELQPAGWQEDEVGVTLTFWLPEGDGTSPRAARALSRLGALGQLQVTSERAGWEDAWRRFHTPHTIGRLYLRPPWYPARDDLLDIVVEAGLAFGTGAHASTRQCLEEIQEMTPGSLLDLGSGSGVVSFAALRLGFAPVWGIDVDPVAVQAAAGNAALNELSPVFLVGDATDPGYRPPAADTVVANIALRPILRLARRFAPGPAGLALAARHVLLAGLLVEQGEEAKAAFPQYGVVNRRTDGTWLMLHLARLP